MASKLKMSALGVVLLAAMGTVALSLPQGAVLASSAQASSYGGPLVITKGGTYRGNWESLDPKVPAVLIQTREPVVIEDSNVRGRGDLIRGYWVNLTVRNTHGYGLNPRTDKAFPGRFLSVEDVLNLRAENNAMESTSGIYVNVFQGKSDQGQGIKILRNRIRNIDGRYVTASGEPSGERYRVQSVQLAHIFRVPNIEIAWNEIINEPGKSSPEENINIYESSGTPESPIKIHNNYVQGAYAINPGKDKTYSGGGIIVGDGRQDSLDVVGGYVEVFRNQVVSTSNQGIAIAGGHNQHVYENRIVSSGRLADGTVIAGLNVGAYVWDYQNGAGRSPRTFFNNSLRNNLIGWVRFDERGKTYYNNLWTPSCTRATGSTCTGNRTWPTPVTLETERQEFALWQRKVRSEGVIVGPTSRAAVND